MHPHPHNDRSRSGNSRAGQEGEGVLPLSLGRLWGYRARVPRRCQRRGDALRQQPPRNPAGQAVCRSRHHHGPSSQRPQGLFHHGRAVHERRCEPCRAHGVAIEQCRSAHKTWAARQHVDPEAVKLVPQALGKHSEVGLGCRVVCHEARALEACHGRDKNDPASAPAGHAAPQLP
jgi:hypothetical protein